MKKLLIFTIILWGCSEENGPIFKISDPKLREMFNKFDNLATQFNVTVPKDNMVLRYVSNTDGNVNTNDSQAYKKGEQLYIDIDQSFINQWAQFQNEIDVLVYQQLANGLLNRQWENCGIMWEIVDLNDIHRPYYNQLDNYYANLFNPSVPC